ncbi:O-antigen ligase family protein [Thermodesulfobacteriota bacterium B35]
MDFNIFSRQAQTTLSIVILITVSGAIALGKLIAIEEYKYIFIGFILPSLALIFRKYWNRKDGIKILIIISFFPTPIFISTTYVGSTSHYIIIFVFCLVTMGYLIGLINIYFTKNIVVILMLLFASGAISTIKTFGNHEIFRTSLWSLIVLMTCICFLLLIDSLYFKSEEEKEKYFIQLINLIIFLTCVQILMGAIVYYFPDVGTYLRIFNPENDKKILITTITDENIKRLRTIVLTVESLGEFVAVLMPYVLYRLIAKKINILYIIYLLVLCAGLVLSATRSGMVLSLFSASIYLLFIEKSLKKKIFLFSAFLLVGLVIFYFDIGVSTTSKRFLEAYYSYETGGTALEVANRSFFKNNLAYLFDTISFFGNGLVSPLKYGTLSVDFHNLFMTILFRYGIVGFVLYFSLPAILFKKTYDKYKLSPNKKINKVILLSIIIFFINECKFEYTRKPYGVLIIWILFSAYFLLIKNVNTKSLELDSGTT